MRKPPQLLLHPPARWPAPAAPAPAAAGPLCRRRRRAAPAGFTLIELLVVIAVILVLIGISIVGLTQVGRHSKDQHTRAALEAMKAMMTEYETGGGKGNWVQFQTRWGNLQQVGANLIAQPLSPTGSPDMVTIYQSGPAPVPPKLRRWQEEYSDLVLADLLTVPNNKAILGKLPSDQVRKVEWPVGSGVYYSEMLDGYGRPLRFVPAGGLRNITTASKTGNLLLQSDGSAHVLGTPTDRAVNPTAFWMSAGADGNYKTVDDNLLSTNQ